MFTSILSESVGSLTIMNTMWCTVVSLLLGLMIAKVYMNEENCSRNFVMSLVLLPALVQFVIMMVNGNLGTSVAVLGTFSLVRFRSVPGTSKEICYIFLSMAIGLANGMGYVTFSLFFTIVTLICYLLMTKLKFGQPIESQKELRVTIPENLDYTEVFDDVFDEYTKDVKLNRVKTTNLGSMYELSYVVQLKHVDKEKAFVDAIRCRNGNLTVICSRMKITREEL